MHHFHGACAAARLPLLSSTASSPTVHTRRRIGRPLALSLWLALLWVLVACDAQRVTPAELEAAAPMAASAPAPEALSRNAGAMAGASVGEVSDAHAASDAGASERHIAVRQMLVVESPGDQLPALSDKLRAQCAALRCELLHASLRQETARQAASASLSLRVAPEDADKLLSALGGSGSIVQHDTHSEDLTAQVIDVQAHIRNRTEFRDSLRTLLAQPEAQRALKDVLEIQRALTQTQAELDSHATQLKALQSRTRMQHIDIELRAQSRVISAGGGNPIARAWDEAGETLAYSAATLITVLAAGLPWVPVLLLALWLLRWLWRRRRART